MPVTARRGAGAEGDVALVRSLRLSHQGTAGALSELLRLLPEASAAEGGAVAQRGTLVSPRRSGHAAARPDAQQEELKAQARALWAAAARRRTAESPPPPHTPPGARRSASAAPHPGRLSEGARGAPPPPTAAAWLHRGALHTPTHSAPQEAARLAGARASVVAPPPLSACGGQWGVASPPPPSSCAPDRGGQQRSVSAPRDPAPHAPHIPGPLGADSLAEANGAVKRALGNSGSAPRSARGRPARPRGRQRRSLSEGSALTGATEPGPRGRSASRGSQRGAQPPHLRHNLRGSGAESEASGPRSVSALHSTLDITPVGPPPGAASADSDAVEPPPRPAAAAAPRAGAGRLGRAERAQRKQQHEQELAELDASIAAESAAQAQLAGSPDACVSPGRRAAAQWLAASGWWSLGQDGPGTLPRRVRPREVCAHPSAAPRQPQRAAQRPEPGRPSGSGARGRRAKQPASGGGDGARARRPEWTPYIAHPHSNSTLVDISAADPQSSGAARGRSPGQTAGTHRRGRGASAPPPRRQRGLSPSALCYHFGTVDDADALPPPRTSGGEPPPRPLLYSVEPVRRSSCAPRQQLRQPSPERSAPVVPSLRQPTAAAAGGHTLWQRQPPQPQPPAAPPWPPAPADTRTPRAAPSGPPTPPPTPPPESPEAPERSARNPPWAMTPHSQGVPLALYTPQPDALQAPEQQHAHPPLQAPEERQDPRRPSGQHRALSEPGGRGAAAPAAAAPAAVAAAAASPPGGLPPLQPTPEPQQRRGELGPLQTLENYEFPRRGSAPASPRGTWRRNSHDSPLPRSNSSGGHPGRMRQRAATLGALRSTAAGRFGPQGSPSVQFADTTQGSLCEPTQQQQQQQQAASLGDVEALEAGTDAARGTPPQRSPQQQQRQQSGEQPRPAALGSAALRPPLSPDSDNPKPLPSPGCMPRQPGSAGSRPAPAAAKRRRSSDVVPGAAPAASAPTGAAAGAPPAAVPREQAPPSPGSRRSSMPPPRTGEQGPPSPASRRSSMPAPQPSFFVAGSDAGTRKLQGQHSFFQAGMSMAGSERDRPSPKARSQGGASFFVPGDGQGTPRSQGSGSIPMVKSSYSPQPRQSPNRASFAARSQGAGSFWVPPSEPEGMPSRASSGMPGGPFAASYWAPEEPEGDPAELLAQGPAAGMQTVMSLGDTQVSRSAAIPAGLHSYVMPGTRRSSTAQQPPESAQKGPPPAGAARRPSIPDPAGRGAAPAAGAPEATMPSGRPRAGSQILVRQGSSGGFGALVEGLTVKGIAPGGAAEQAGVREGMVIAAIDGREVRTDAEVAEALAAAPESFVVRVLPEGTQPQQAGPAVPQAPQPAAAAPAAAAAGALPRAPPGEPPQTKGNCCSVQ